MGLRPARDAVQATVHWLTDPHLLTADLRRTGGIPVCLAYKLGHMVTLSTHVASQQQTGRAHGAALPAKRKLPERAFPSNTHVELPARRSA